MRLLLLSVDEFDVPTFVLLFFVVSAISVCSDLFARNCLVLILDVVGKGAVVLIVVEDRLESGNGRLNPSLTLMLTNRHNVNEKKMNTDDDRKLLELLVEQRILILYQRYLSCNFRVK
mmetsp:Transcript_57310/g.66201  ORF Transcript_57310/g.66201 Transcript_57310/m.66201 type:complete len:118 (-) Transcript_57310:83-436(-)